MIEITEETYKEALNRLANTDDGKIVLAVLKSLCNWDMTILSSDDATKTLYYAAKRGVYGSVRKNILPKHLKAIEFDYAVRDNQT